MTILSGQQLVKTFGEGTEKQTVLDGVSLAVKEGEFVAVMGPSGSGKSTLLFALSGIESVDRGTVIFDEMVLSGLKDDELAELRRTEMGFVFQQPALLRNLNLLDNIILPALRSNRRNKAEIVARAKLLMDQTGIGGLEKRDVTQVSGGQLQRAGICRALLGNPKIIFGDEPTGALNSQSAQDILNLLSDINAGGTAVLLVTHDAAVAARSERVVFMRDGGIASELRLPRSQGPDPARVSLITARLQELGI